MALGSVHSGFSITEGKARMETDETFETLLSPHHNRPYPYLNPGGKFPRLSEKDIARGSPDLQSAFLALRLVRKLRTVEAAVCANHYQFYGVAVLTSS
jgi:hypothetical protein